MRKIRRDVGDRMPEYRKDNEDDQVKKIIDRLEGILRSSVLSDFPYLPNDPKLKLRNDLFYLFTIVDYFSMGKINKENRAKKKFYERAIANIEKNFNNFVPEDLIKDLKDLKEKIFNVKNDDEVLFKQIEDRLEKIKSLVKKIPEKTERLEKLEDDLKDLKSMTLSLSQDKIEVDRNLIETYKKIIEDTKIDFYFLPEESRVDIEKNFNFVPEDLIEDLEKLVNLIKIILDEKARLYSPDVVYLIYRKQK